MRNEILRAAAIGAAQGALLATLVILTSEKRSFANDWFLAVMVVFANAVGYAIAAYFQVNFLGVAIAGLAGMFVGGWLGSELIGNWEYAEPVPQNERELRIVAKGQERAIPIPGAPVERVKRIPVGGGIGVLVGFALGATAYGLFRRRDELFRNPPPENEPPIQ